RKLPVTLGPEADVAWIDAVLGERLGAGGIFGEQRVAVVVEVADEGHHDAHLRQPIANVRYGLGPRGPIYRDANDLRSRAGERRRLASGGFDVGGVGVGHRLHDDWGIAADDDAANGNGEGSAAGDEQARHRSIVR